MYFQGPSKVRKAYFRSIMLATDLFRNMQKELSEAFGLNEAKAMTRILFEDLLGLSESELLIGSHELNNEQLQMMNDALSRALKHEPVQYISGKVHWLNFELKVNPSVLIPRPETEELVLHVKNSGIKADKIIDIGTGSACIALAMKEIFPNAEVMALDVSKKALEIAEENSGITGLSIQTIHADILKWQERDWPFFDLIVSNPPYVSLEDKAAMEKRVLEFEPHLALFSENDPLVFYKSIYDFASQYLNEEGIIYFEINEAYGQEVLKEGQERGFTGKIIQDLHNKDRFVMAQKKGA